MGTYIQEIRTMTKAKGTFTRQNPKQVRRREDGKAKTIREEQRLRRVAKIVIDGEAGTTREIAELVGVSKGTAHRDLVTLRQDGTIPRMQDLVAKDVELSILIQDEMKRRIQEDAASISGQDLKGFSELFLKRAQLLSGQPTDIVAQVTVNIM